MTSARRLAAILAADVVGYYSRLMGANETGRANAVRERADVYADVAEHDGRLVKTTGDDVMLEFPSVVAAVGCAIAI